MTSVHLEITFLAALALAGIHVIAGKLRFLQGIPRSIWLSMAAGVPVAFVFLQILPTLARDQKAFAQLFGPDTEFQQHVYVVSLIGLAFFYGVERVVKISRQNNCAAGKADASGKSAFWLGISSFTAMNAIIGYLLIQEPRSFTGLALFFTAMALKFLVNDYGLHEDHKTAYDRHGRWIAAAGVLLGWSIGYWITVPEAGIAALRGFLIGGILLNVLKEELPPARQSRYWAFILGAGAYAVLLSLLQLV